MAGTDEIVTVFDKYFDSRMENVHTIIPGKIESYSGHTTRKAVVKPLIKLLRKDGDSLEIPPIDNVPVIFPSSAGFQFLFPLKKNDGCLILFAETGIGGYLDGQGKIDVDADDISRFSLTDAICIPGLWPFSAVPKGIKTIEFTDNNEIIFLEGTEPFVLGNILKTELNKDLSAMTELQSAINGWTPVPNDGGLALKTALATFLTKPMAVYTSILSEKIKGK